MTNKRMKQVDERAVDSGSRVDDGNGVSGSLPGHLRDSVLAEASLPGRDAGEQRRWGEYFGSMGRGLGLRAAMLTAGLGLSGVAGPSGMQQRAEGGIIVAEQFDELSRQNGLAVNAANGGECRVLEAESGGWVF